jgi:predicted nucleic acid-binding Zn ribbon protein
VHRVIAPVGVIFKGSGFYVTDNRPSRSGRSWEKDSSRAGKDNGGGGSGTTSTAESQPLIDETK